jgi:hypothetical protein
VSGLAFAQAPPPSHPLRFLFTAAGWGVVAGLWLAAQGEAAMLSRWAPATLVLVHMLALGLLGNAMLGSLVQFLPVAAGSPLPWPRAVPALHVAFNAGLACLLPVFFPGVAGGVPGAGLAPAAVSLLAGSLAAFAAMAAWAVLRGRGEGVARAGIGVALASLLGTVALGVGLLAMRKGWIEPAAWPLVDLHAALGLGGWALGLVAAVAGVAMPMLQGTRTPPRLARCAWTILLVAGLCAFAGAAAGVFPESAARLLPIAMLVFALAVPWLQWHAPHPRNPVLRGFWRFGSVALMAAAGVAWMPLPPNMQALAVGVLVLGIGLPALVLGMVLEIVPFLAWIALRQRLPRGTRVPGVGSLLEPARKRRVLAACLLAWALLVAALAWPGLAGAAGVGLAVAYGMAGWTVHACWRDARRATQRLAPTGSS